MSKKQQGTNAAAVEKRFGVTLPERLRRFFDDKESAQHQGRWIHGLPNFSNDTKMPLDFASRRLGDIFEYASEGHFGEIRSYLPLAAAGKENRMVAVDLSKPELPVLFFDYEDGFHSYAPGFDAFLRGLLAKGELTPLERLAAAYKEAHKLNEKKDYAAVEAKLAPLLSLIPDRQPDSFDDLANVPGRVLNLLGLAREHQGDVAGALTLYDRATALGSDVAALNVCRLYQDHFRDVGKLIPYAQALKARVMFALDPYTWFHVRRYLGRAYVATGREADAVVAFHQIKKFLQGTDVKKVREAEEDLRELAGAEAPGREIAARILTWYAAPAPAPDPAAVAATRAWWNKVPATARAALLKAINTKGKPDDEALARARELESVDLEHCEIEDAGFLADMPELKRLKLAGNALASPEPIAKLRSLELLEVRKTGITSLTPLAALTRLESLSCGENPISSFGGLEGLTRLTSLRAHGTEVSDLAPLAGLRELKDLSVYNSRVTDLAPLAGCTRLKQISCFGSAVDGNNAEVRGLAALAVLPRLRRIDVHRYGSDDARALQAARPDVDIDDHQGKLWDPTAEELAALHAFWRDRGRLGRSWRKALEKLLDSDADADRPTDEQLIEMVTKESLYFWKLGLTSAAPLAHFRWATKLTLSENRIEDLAPLAGMTRLEHLTAPDNLIGSLAPLAGLTLLEELDVTRNRLGGLTGVGHMRELRELSIDGNQIESLAEVAGMTKLRYLAAVENRIDDLAPLAGLTRLTSLYVYGNRIRDLAPLAGCEELEVVECFANPGITGLMALVRLPRLKTVLTHSGLPADEIAAFRKARPDVRVD